MDRGITMKEAAALVGIRPDSLLKAVGRGAIPCHWKDSAFGRYRVFEESDLAAYRERIRAQVAARLAKLDGAAA